MQTFLNDINNKKKNNQQIAPVMQTFLDKFITKKSKSKKTKKKSDKPKKPRTGASCPWNLKKDKCNSREGCAFDENKGSKGQCAREKIKVGNEIQELGLGSVDDLKGQLLALEAPPQLEKPDLMELD